MTNNKEKDLLYIAGGLFSEAQMRQRNYEKEILTERFGEVLEVFSPLTDNPSNDKSTNPTANDIFANDTLKIINSKYIFAELDGEDVGVNAEIAFASGINFMLAHIGVALVLTDSPKDMGIGYLKEMVETIPLKTVVAHLSDIRIPNAGNYEGHHVPVGYNQYCMGLIESMGKICPSTDEAIEELNSLIKSEDK